MKRGGNWQGASGSAEIRYIWQVVGGRRQCISKVTGNGGRCCVAALLPGTFFCQALDEKMKSGGRWQLAVASGKWQSGNKIYLAEMSRFTRFVAFG